MMISLKSKLLKLPVELYLQGIVINFKLMLNNRCLNIIYIICNLQLLFYMFYGFSILLADECQSGCCIKQILCIHETEAADRKETEKKSINWYILIHFTKQRECLTCFLQHVNP